MSPSEVNESNEGTVLRKLYGKQWLNRELPKKRSKKKKLSVGDLVRISRVKGIFEKGYMGNWTIEIFKIKEVIDARPYTLYKLEDLAGVLIEGSFYDHELQLITKDLDGYFNIEKTLHKRTVKGKKLLFVKWEGYPASMNSWVEDVKDL
jgi:hypothetical protein